MTLTIDRQEPPTTSPDERSESAGSTHYVSPSASASASALASGAASDRAASPAARERGLLYYIGLGASAALLLIVIVLALILIVVPRVAGAVPLTVLTTSMEPRYPPGTLLYVLPVKASEVKLGDVITYQIQSGNPAVISHRVIAINSPANGKRTFILKGDNNSVPDPAAVVAGQVKARLWYSVPLLGWVNNAVNGTKRSWIVDAIAVALFAYAAYMIVGGLIAASRARRSKGAAVE